MKPMSKTAALERVNAGVTFGELRQAIAAGRTRPGMSKLNKALTVEQAAEIFSASIRSRLDTERVEATRYSAGRGRHVASTWAIIATNILREFGAPPA